MEVVVPLATIPDWRLLSPQQCLIEALTYTWAAKLRSGSPPTTQPREPTSGAMQPSSIYEQPPNTTGTDFHPILIRSALGRVSSGRSLYGRGLCLHEKL